MSPREVSRLSLTDFKKTEKSTSRGAGHIEVLSKYLLNEAGGGRSISSPHSLQKRQCPDVLLWDDMAFPFNPLLCVVNFWWLNLCTHDWVDRGRFINVTKEQLISNFKFFPFLKRPKRYLE